MSNAVPASKDPPVPRDSPAEMETTALLATTEVLAAPAETPKSERNFCPCHPSAPAYRSLAAAAHPDPKATTVHPETMVPPDWMVALAQRDQMAHPASLDSPDVLDRRDHPENPDSFALENDHQQADLARTDALDNLDSPVAPERVERTATTDRLASPAVPATVAHPAATENLDSPETLDNLALLAAATTAHRPVWLPVIKVDMQAALEQLVSVLLLMASFHQNSRSTVTNC